MNQPLPWMRGDFEPTRIMTDLLKSKLTEARRVGDQVTESLALNNLRSLGYKATG